MKEKHQDKLGLKKMYPTCRIFENCYLCCSFAAYRSIFSMKNNNIGINKTESDFYDFIVTYLHSVKEKHQDNLDSKSKTCTYKMYSTCKIFEKCHLYCSFTAYRSIISHIVFYINSCVKICCD